MSLATAAKGRRQLNIFPHAAPGILPSWMTLPALSIVLPTYNHADFLPAAIESVLEEPELLELIIVDDGSTDHTAELLDRYRANSRLRIVRQDNQGLPRALNTGFSIARGVYVGWTSADNLFLTGTIRRLASYLQANPEVGLVYGNVRLIDESGAPFQGSSYRVEDQDPADSSVLLLPLAGDTLAARYDNFINACVLFRGELLRSTGAHNAALLGFEDYDYWLRLSLQARLAHIDTEEPLYEYRLHRSSLTSTLGSDVLAVKQRSTVDSAAALERARNEGVALELHGSGLGEWEPALKRCIERAGHRLEQRNGLLINRSRPRLTVRLSSLTTPGEPVGLSFPSESRLLHSSHLRCLAGAPNVPLLLLGGGTRPLTPEAVLPPPLELPPILRRARDGGFGAVAPDPASESVLLVFPPDQPGIGTTPKLENAALDERYEWCRRFTQTAYETFSRSTFVLFCRTASQRAFADALHLAVKDRRRLRIIDCSGDSEAAQDESLMFVLGSVDCICAIKAAVLDQHTALETRIEAGIAALAGLPIMLCVEEFEAPELPDDDSRVSLLLRRSLVSMPHLCIHVLSPQADAAASARTRQLPQSGELSHHSLEQLLRTMDAAAIGRKAAAFALALQLAPLDD